MPSFERGRIIIGTNNALPPGAAFSQINTLSSGVGDRRVIFDLNGYNQTLSSIREVFPGGVNGLNLIGNNSTNSDSVFTYAGTGTNTWGIQLVDTLDNPDIPHKLGLTVTSGLLELLNTNTYTGPTLVTGGKLLVSTLVLNTISTLYGSLDATPVTVNGTGIFGGNGTVAGSVTVGTGGTLVPGDSFSYLNSSGVSTPVTRIGQLTLMGTDLSFGAGSRGVFEVDLGAHTNDQVVGIGTLTYCGSLVISNIGVQVFTNGTVLKLFDAAIYVAGPVAVQPNSPAPGLMWDTSSLTVDGTLRVTTTIAPTLANAARLPDGNITFQINGELGQGYSVRATTNIACRWRTGQFAERHHYDPTRSRSERHQPSASVLRRPCRRTGRSSVVIPIAILILICVSVQARTLPPRHGKEEPPCRRKSNPPLCPRRPGSRFRRRSRIPRDLLRSRPTRPNSNLRGQRPGERSANAKFLSNGAAFGQEQAKGQWSAETI